MVSPIFAGNFLKVLSFKLFLLADVYNYCEEQRIKLFIDVYALNIENLRSNFFDFFFLIKHFASTIRAGLAKKIFNSNIFDMFTVKKISYFSTVLINVIFQ